MVTLLDPFLIPPDNEQRVAMEIAAGYLSRASSHAATRLMMIHDAHARKVDMDEMAASLERAALLIRSIAGLAGDE